MDKDEQIKGMANPSKDFTGYQEALSLQRRPLTLEDLAEALNVEYLENQQIEDARAVEAAHGIK